MNVFTVIIGFVSQFLIIKYLIVKTVKIKPRHFEKIYKILKQENGIKLVVKESLEDKEVSVPSIYNGLFLLKNFPYCYINHDEQLLTAGFSSKETNTFITIFRWNFKHLRNFTDKIDHASKTTISVYISTGNSERYLGFLQMNRSIEIESKFHEIENDCINTIKSSFLLYGPPGNGKTTFIRNLAKKHGYNLYYVDFNKETTNSDILSLASFIPDKSIILFEDFDALYEKRNIVKFKECNFSFDAILNLIDGVYNENNNIIYAFTCNDLAKIDSSLLDRRGRIKHKIEVLPPNFDKRLELLKNEKLAYETEGMSLDNIYHLINEQNVT